MLTPYRKKLTLICAIILALIVIFYGTVYILCKIYLNPKTIQETIVNQAKVKFNRTVTVGNDIEFDIDWDMSPHLVLHDVAIANSPWASNPHILTAKEIEFHFSLANILLKQISIHTVNLIEPAVYLETKGSQTNWDDLHNDINATPSSTLRLTMHKIQVEHGTLSYNNDKTDIEKLDFVTRNDFSNMHFHLQATHHNLPIKATIEIDSLITYFKLNIVTMHVGNSDITGNLNIEKSPVKISGKFESDKLVLSDFLNNGANTSGEYVISKSPIPVALLRGSEFDVTVKIGVVDLGGLQLNKFALQAKNVKDVINIKLNPGAIIDNGKLDLNIDYNLNPATPTLSLQAKTTTLQFESILRQMFGKAPIEGSSLDFSSNLQGQGSDFNTIVGSLSGQILLVAGPGEFENSAAAMGSVFTNVLSSVITFDKQLPSTGFKCGVMNFKVNNGVANARNGIGVEAAS
ncbi:MAG TPA: AsmA family protein, partial [Gammaproteobacteria bacterium]|nr:AsmA family protein [Gammaproteobacteria bacterium]